MAADQDIRALVSRAFAAPARTTQDYSIDGTPVRNIATIELTSGRFAVLAERESESEETSIGDRLIRFADRVTDIFES